ncbi:MAG: BTAD domain-containing putative transcriptional regulator [Pseudomonadota bacterium]
MNDPPVSRIKSIVPAKLTRPSSRGVLPRERLFHSINVGREKKVIWISGPAGSGKTTLIASYIDSVKAPCLWYELDESDADLASFFYYLGIATKNIAPRNRKPLPLFTPEYLQGILIFAKRFFEQLGAILMGQTRLRHPLEVRNPAIVFDNYQDVPEDSVFPTVINAGLTSLPQGVNVIMLSRTDPPPAYARLRAAGEMSILGWEDIRLTAEESNAIATLKAGTELPGKTLSLLYHTTDGWAAGLVLFMESLRIKDFDGQLPRGLPREEIFAYFATELFERRSQEDQAFLIETSFLHGMNVRMAEELTGNVRTKRIFSVLNRKNYFINRYFSHEQAFQYHPLFREFLQVKAEEVMTSDHLQGIRRRAAQVLEANGRSEDAVSLLCQAHEWSEATRVILSFAPVLISQGRWQTLQGWIESLPGSLTENQSWLLYWKGICRFPTSPEGSMEYFAKAFEQFNRCKNAAGSFLALSGMLDSVNFRLDTFFELDRLITMMDELREEYPQFPSPEIESHVVNSMLNALTLRQPFNPTWKQWEDRGFALLRDITNTDLAIHILCGLAFYRLFTGEIEQVKPILDSIHQRVDAGHASSLAVLSLRDLQAFYYWFSADFEKNRWAAEDGIALAESSGVHFMDIYLLGHGAAGALSIGEIARTDGYLDKMLSAIRTMPGTYGEYFYHILKAWKYLLEGHLVQASIHADQALEFSAVMGRPLLIPTPHLIKAIIRHQLKDDAAAFVHLSELRKIGGTMSLFHAEFMAFLIEAQIAFDHGDEAGGRALLSRAMAIGSVHGYANGFFWVNATMARLCVKALEAGIETDYVRSLIIKRNMVPDVPVLHLENWPWPLKIYTLGPFEMVRDEVLVRFSGKVQQKPLLLLKALIAFGGKDVNEEHLCDALWPDTEGDLAQRSFDTTLYRLRQLIGKDKAIHLKEGRLTLNMHCCWVDAFAMAKVLKESEELFETVRRCQGDSQTVRDTATQAIRLTRMAIDLYKGHFLEAEPERSWLISPRERLRTKYIRGIEALAGYWETTGELNMATKCYEKALEVDDLAEEFYQHLMIIYRQLGLRAKALEVYSRCRSVLETRLGIEPSRKTESILATLRCEGNY